jgi:hypothetical protein
VAPTAAKAVAPRNPPAPNAAASRRRKHCGTHLRQSRRLKLRQQPPRSESRRPLLRRRPRTGYDSHHSPQTSEPVRPPEGARRTIYFGADRTGPASVSSLLGTFRTELQLES